MAKSTLSVPALLLLVLSISSGKIPPFGLMDFAEFSLMVVQQARIHRKTNGVPKQIVSFLMVFVGLTCEGPLELAYGQEKTTWCVAKPSSSDAELTANIQFACDQVYDCKLIEEGGPCFLPDNLIHHASVVMNLYYKMMGHNGWNCDFRSSGLITVTDPSKATNPFACCEVTSCDFKI
ncbi:Glucan endo-1,3-beta-D-glucosidase [Morella rubra]|uniref:Glucan endo-1,3-beta-D-glucosidase n=1 Tax=Morella rubra TaxID=262757 RepID=A0A6A1WCF7_9ROSI|nr:Glucan endo-1,3-beta-D-glucosidase [Morella rubra]